MNTKMALFAASLGFLALAACDSSSGDDEGGTETAESGAADTETTQGDDGSGGCESPPAVPEGVSDECRAELLSCYSSDCDSFEYDPNDCWQTTLGFPQCDGAAGGSSTGFDDSTSSGSTTGTGSGSTDTGEGSTGTGSGSTGGSSSSSG